MSEVKKKCQIKKKQSMIGQWIVIKRIVTAEFDGEVVSSSEAILRTRFVSHKRARAAVRRLMIKIMRARTSPALGRTCETQWDLKTHQKGGRLVSRLRFRIGRKGIMKCK